jgi:hypothetical protein
MVLCADRLDGRIDLGIEALCCLVENGVDLPHDRPLAEAADLDTVTSTPRLVAQDLALTRVQTPRGWDVPCPHASRRCPP